jgi:phage-related protein
MNDFLRQGIDWIVELILSIHDRIKEAINNIISNIRKIVNFVDDLSEIIGDFFKKLIGDIAALFWGD